MKFSDTTVILTLTEHYSPILSSFNSIQFNVFTFTKNHTCMMYE